MDEIRHSEVTEFIQTALGDAEGPRFELLVYLVGQELDLRELAADATRKASLSNELTPAVARRLDYLIARRPRPGRGPDSGQMMQLMQAGGRDESSVGNTQRNHEDRWVPPDDKWALATHDSTRSHEDEKPKGPR